MNSGSDGSFVVLSKAIQPDHIRFFLGSPMSRDAGAAGNVSAEAVRKHIKGIEHIKERRQDRRADEALGRPAVVRLVSADGAHEKRDASGKACGALVSLLRRGRPRRASLAKAQSGPCRLRFGSRTMPEMALSWSAMPFAPCFRREVLDFEHY